MSEQVQINLLSFQRKTIDSYLLKAHIRSTGAVLMRRGRSRNWILQANTEQFGQIINLIEAAQQPSWLWLVKVLSKQHQQLSQDQLLKIVKRNPSITLNSLITLTNCTREQGRVVLDMFEWLE